VVDFGTCAKPEWPKSSLRNEETGTVTLSFLISADGRVGDSKVVKSSGFRDLDKAAVVGIAKCKFKPATVDGHPQETWQQMQYVWTLE
jgi:protein TonB